MTDAIQLTGVSKWVGDGEQKLSILSDIHLSIEAGDYVGIMGASGSGKSTLLNIVGMLDVASAGYVSLFGRQVSTLTDEESAHLRTSTIGFIFQSFHLLNYLTAQENVMLPLGYARHADPESESVALLKKMQLDHRANAYPMTLSGGEKQRVAIARALANRPALILADEPTGALDSKTGAHVMDMIGLLNSEGATVLVVTHDEKVARRARRIVHMKDGRIE